MQDITFLPLDFGNSKEKVKKERAGTKFLSDLFGVGFIGKFRGHILESVPSAKDESSAIEIYAHQIKQNHAFFVMTMGWSEEEFRIVVWNIARESPQKPFSKETYKRYRQRYYYSELETPPRKGDIL